MAEYTFDLHDLEKKWQYIEHPAYSTIHFMIMAVYLPVSIKNGDEITITHQYNLFFGEYAIPTVMNATNPLIGDAIYSQVNVPDYEDKKSGIRVLCSFSNPGQGRGVFEYGYYCYKYDDIFTMFGYAGNISLRANTSHIIISPAPVFFDSKNHWVSPRDYPGGIGDVWKLITPNDGDPSSGYFLVSNTAPNSYTFPSEYDTGTVSIGSGLEGYFLKPTHDTMTATFYDLGELIKGDLPDPKNPYPDGGDDPDDDDNKPGDYDHKSDPVPEPDLPTVSVTDSGLVTLFAPTESQLKSLANYLWSDAFSLDNFKKMLNNPMDCILGLSIVPVNVPRGSAREITVGNIVTTVSCDICRTQYVKVDCGTFTFDRHDMTNSYLDYAPYSKCYLYLPFIGVQEINIDDFMQSTMHVVYHVDILTGAMFCYVMRDNSVMYTYMGQCAENVPLSSSSYSNTIGSIMSAAASIVGVASMAATGGATAPVAAGLLAGATTSTANAVTSLKPSVAHSGSIGGGAGIMGVNYPYLIFNTPHISIPSQQRHYTGYPSNQIVKLSALKGFNMIQAINLSVSGANDAEMNEIENILKGGVIL